MNDRRRAAWRRVVLVSLVALALGPGHAGAALLVYVDYPMRDRSVGQPAYLRVTVRNIGREPQHVWAFWFWNSAIAQDEKDSPITLGRYDNGTWQALPLGPFRRGLDEYYTTQLGDARGRGLTFGAEQEFDVWWDVGWHGDLPVGRFRADLKWKIMEVYNYRARPGVTRIHATERARITFDVTAVDRLPAHQRAFEAAQSAPPRGPGRDRYDWLRATEPKLLGDTSYAAWSYYFALEDYLTVAEFVPSQRLRELFEEPQLVLGLEALDKMALHARLRQGLDVEQAVQAALASATPEAGLVPLLDELSRHRDVEWADLLGRRVLKAVADARATTGTAPSLARLEQEFGWPRHTPPTWTP